MTEIIGWALLRTALIVAWIVIGFIVYVAMIEGFAHWTARQRERRILRSQWMGVEDPRRTGEFVNKGDDTFQNWVRR